MTYNKSEFRNNFENNNKKQNNNKTKIPKNKSTEKISFREKIQFYMIDCKTPIGKSIDFLIILLNLIICLIFVLDTYTLDRKISAFLFRLELIIVFFFILEFILRLYGAKDRVKHFFDIYSIIDIIAILPTFLFLFPVSSSINLMKTIRIFRAFRIFRFLRFTVTTDFFFGTITLHFLKVIKLVVTIFIIFFISSGIFYYAESPVNPDIKNFGDAFYFSVVTLTTVGFGDITPLSDFGRWVVVLMIFSGIILIPWEASQIVKEWLIISSKNDIICPKCGLRYHDKDASHCKSCGHIIYQEYDGN
jgi:voltage-gated potassium channel